MWDKIVYLSLVGAFLLGCDKKIPQEAEKPLIVITSPDNPPFEFKDTAKGGDAIIGLDMEVIQKISHHLGRPIKIIEADFAGLLPALQAGRADMAIAAIGATEERRKAVDFSDPYYLDTLALLVPGTSPLTTQTELTGQKVGVQLGSLHETTANKWRQTIPNLYIISLNKIGELVQELKNKRLQAILIDESTARQVAAATPGLKVVPCGPSGGGNVIAFPKGSPWVAPINKILGLMKDELQTIKKKWIAP